MAGVKRVRRGRVDAGSSDNEIAGTLSEIRKRFGDNTVTPGSSVVQPDRISTGVFMLDFCLLGGIPMSRASMIVGEKHAGKSLLACKIAAGAQERYPDQQVVYVDVEGTLDTVWAAKLGVDLDSLLVVQPETGESAIDMTDALIHTKEVSLVVIDSIAALAPMKEIEDSAEDAHVGLQARLVGGMIRKATSGMIAERKRSHDVALLFINQYRTKIGGYSPYGEAKSIPGGKALEFSTSVQIVVKNKENSGKDDRGVDAVSENEHTFQITKNKLNAGVRAGEFRVRRMPHAEYGLDEGAIDDASTMLAFAKKFGVYTGGGSSWTLEFWDESRKFKGMNDAIISLYEDPDLRMALRNYLIYEQAKSLSMPDDFLERFL